MLEIIILVAMCRHLHGKAKKKGWPGWPFVLLMIFGWFVFGIGAGIAGIIISGDDGDIPIGGIIGYLLGVVLACVTNVLIVALLPDRGVQDDDEDYSDRRRRRFRQDSYESDEADEDDRRGRRRRDDREDEEDRDDRRDRRRRDDRDDDLDDRNWRPRRDRDDR